MPPTDDPQVRKYRPQAAETPVKLSDLRKVQTGEAAQPVPEIGGRKDGPDPTRYGDWEKNGRCIDF